ncbi:MarR family transcriptional regulator [Streptosporangiaceae bacterium NEAU-GS5]|nr:MarR family transcriptional regulator [Streptosporangiaceae bacterium NEAU-GS5]
MCLHETRHHGKVRGMSTTGVAADPKQMWRDLLARHADVSCALERELGEKHDLGLSEFEVLDRMAESHPDCRDPGGKFRVQELAEQVHLSQSALSRLIARLERMGLVERAMCDFDRRGVFVVLTGEGRRRHAEASPTHQAVLAQKLG